MAEALEIARRADDAFNAHDVEGRMAENSAETELVIPGGIQVRGREQAQILQTFWEALPDVTITWENQLESGSTVVVEGYLQGTHSGAFRTPQGEIPPSGNKVKLPYASIKRIEAGKIASEHLYFDQMEFLQQLGAMPPGASSS